ncbi:MAG TPA: hypothetical protein VFA16_10310 [Mycobacterium sp.]|uniref:hypothetical protein n=1 Tax=Mycobacterium sp. TaxID=1785 RepID=UPI002D4A0BA2|nr:hypothetical protein [Mycobacterium sp.]HZU47623.1 hypothetical protein [Mycobacterium sp.]
MRRSLRTRALIACATVLVAALGTVLPARADQWGGGNEDAYINHNAYVNGQNVTWTASIEYEYQCGEDSYGDPEYCYGYQPVNYNVWVTGSEQVTTYDYGATNAGQQQGGECYQWDVPCGSYYADYGYDGGAIDISRGSDPGMPYQWDPSLLESDNQHWEWWHYSDSAYENTDVTASPENNCNKNGQYDVVDCWSTPTDEEYWDPGIINNAQTDQNDGGDSASGWTQIVVGTNNYGN